MVEKEILNSNEFFKVDGTTAGTISDIKFSPSDIIEAINEIKVNSSGGPDNIPAVFLRECKHTLAEPIYQIWRKSLDKGVIPSKLKEGLITPIFKGGSRGLPANYRPVCLTSHLTKVFERVVRKNIVKYLENTNKFNSRFPEGKVVPFPTPEPPRKHRQKCEQREKHRCDLSRFCKSI